MIVYIVYFFLLVLTYNTYLIEYDFDILPNDLSMNLLKFVWTAIKPKRIVHIRIIQPHTGTLGSFLFLVLDCGFRDLTADPSYAS